MSLDFNLESYWKIMTRKTNGFYSVSAIFLSEKTSFWLGRRITVLIFHHTNSIWHSDGNVKVTTEKKFPYHFTSSIEFRSECLLLLLRYRTICSLYSRCRELQSYFQLMQSYMGFCRFSNLKISIPGFYEKNRPP